MTNCTCTHAGFCQRHQVYKTEYWVHLCRTRQDYFEAWEYGIGPGQTPLGVVRRTEPIVMEPLPVGGPGTELKKLLGRFGIKEHGGCRCRDHAYLMDVRGPQWCREHIETIVGWLAAESRKRGWPSPGPLVRFLIRRAIANAERATSATSPPLRSEP